MGDEPLLIRGVTGKAAAQLIVDAAADHLVETQTGLVQRGGMPGIVIVVQQIPDRKGLGKFWGAAKASPHRIGGLEKMFADLNGYRGIDTAVFDGTAAGMRSANPKRSCGSHMFRKRGSLVLYLAPPFPEGFRYTGEDLPPGVPVVDRAGWEIGAPIKGAGIGGQKDIERPAAAARDRLHRIHVNMIQIGTLLPVDLDVDEMLVHVPGSLRVFETFPLHDMAPMTRGIPDAHQDRFVLLAGRLQGLFPPGIPVHRVMGMLQ